MAHLTLSLFSYLDLCSLCPSRRPPRNHSLGRPHSYPAERCPFFSSSCCFAPRVVRCLSPLQIRSLHWLCDLSRPPRGSRCSYFEHGPFQLVGLREAGSADRPRELNYSRRFELKNTQRRPGIVRRGNLDAQTSKAIATDPIAMSKLLHYFDIAESGLPASASICSSIVHDRLHVDQRTAHGT